jgi:polysaccharide biosynthesis/export protein
MRVKSFLRKMKQPVSGSDALNPDELPQKIGAGDPLANFIPEPDVRQCRDRARRRPQKLARIGSRDPHREENSPPTTDRVSAMKLSGTALKFCNASVASLVLVVCLASSSAFADYKLQPGDALEVAVVGIPALKQQAVIGVEGKISLPLIGEVKVGGLTLPRAKAEISQDLANKVYRGSGSGGGEVPYLILPSDVVVTVAQYRPIYIDGDVAKPGAQDFRPGMTVRQAIAVAGGYGLARAGVANPYMEAADLQAEYRALWSELDLQEARAWLARAELGDGKVRPVADREPGALRSGSAFMAAANEEYRARIAERNKDETFLQQAMGKTNEQLNMLTAKQRDDEEGSKADIDDFRRVQQLYRRGLATITRLSDTRRSALLSSDQLLQTIVQISNIERQRSQYGRELEKGRSQDRVRDLAELQNAELRLAQITARLQSTNEKLRYMGLLRSQLSAGSGTRVITVHRMDDGKPQTIVAPNEDLQLAPGDVVDVALQNDRNDVVATLPPAAPKQPADASPVPNTLLTEATAPPAKKTP